MITTTKFRLLAPLPDAVRRIIKNPVAHALKYRTVWGQRIFNDNTPFLKKNVCCCSLSLSLSISGWTTVQRRAMIVGSTRTPQTNKEWKAFPPLGPYYGKDWFIEREEE
jgi:hypothetical protein